MNIRYLLLVAILMLGSATMGCASKSTRELSTSDLEKMRAAANAYCEAWLSNDAEAVMATFVAEPVLSPSGMPYMEGQEAARGFWWPEDLAPTKVTRFEYEELEADGSGGMGFVRGTYTLDFEYDGATYTNIGKYVHILRKVPGVGWRISHHLWNDLPL